jgi:hypothetical protein
MPTDSRWFSTVAKFSAAKLRRPAEHHAHAFAFRPYEKQPADRSEKLRKNSLGSWKSDALSG